jgi:hypothetical protein
MKVHVQCHVPGFVQSILHVLLPDRRSEFDAEVLDHRLLLNELAFSSLEKSDMIQLLAHGDGVCALIGPDPETGIAGYGNTADEALCSLAWAIEAEHYRRLKELREPAPDRERKLAWS